MTQYNLSPKFDSGYQSSKSIPLATQEIMTRMFEENTMFKPVVSANGVSIVTNKYAVSEAAQSGNTNALGSEIDKTFSVMRNDKTIYNALIENSTTSDFNKPIGPYEQFLSTVIKPLTVNIGKKAVWNPSSKTTTLVDAKLDDIMKPMSSATVQPFKEKMVASLMNFNGHNLVVQSPMRPNPYDTRNQQVSIGDFERIEAPQASYARTISYDVVMREGLKANAFYGNSVSIEDAISKTLELDERKYIYDILSGDETPIYKSSFVQQEDDVIETNTIFAGLPYTYGIFESTDEEFIALVERIRQTKINISGYTEEAFNQINGFYLPQTELIKLASAFYFDPQAPVSNIKQAYNYRLDYLVDKLSQVDISVIGLNQCEPNNQVISIPGTLGIPVIPRRNPLPNNKSLYILSSDNSSANQDIIFAPKVPFMQTSFVSPDNLGWEMKMIKVEFFSGMRYMRPALNRYVATTPNA